MVRKSYSMEFGGRTLSIETGKVARQANGSVVVRYGDTVVLVTATMAAKPREDVDFFPLTVDYEAKMYAAGKIPGGFIKREGKPSSEATLCARLIDRPLRPLFPQGLRQDIQIVATVLSVDGDNEPEIAAMLGASCALSISDIPFGGPIAGVRVGYIDDAFVINPTEEQRKRSSLRLTVAGTEDAVMMVEAGADELPESVVLDAIFFAHKAIQRLITLERRMVEECGKEKQDVLLMNVSEELRGKVRSFAYQRLNQAVRQKEKLLRDAGIEKLREETEREILAGNPEQRSALNIAFHDLEKEVVRRMITQEKIRPDGRRLDEVRPISCEAGVLPRVHGSGLFTRGQTQVLTVTTLGPVSEAQVIDGLEKETKKRYIHHYNFPGYCVGEARPMRSPGRREIGHGALAERALLPVIPSEESFPYTIRLVSEVLESNGSSSMASVCGSTLSLMDAGVPIKRPVSGIAMGLVKADDGYSILTDIQGMEDALGDMDFKVAGTTEGITALQMDIKVNGVSRDILAHALAQARKGRMFILDKMLSCIDKPREELSPYAPRIETIRIPIEKIREVIGKGGEVVKGITEATGTEIDIHEDGSIFLASPEKEGMAKAKEMIEQIIHEVKPGEIYSGQVTRIMGFGVFVKILPHKEGLCRLSELSSHRIEKPETTVHVGDTLQVKVIGIDSKGRINLSHKALYDKKKQPQKDEVDEA